ncbi:hypothetical protein P7K49_022942 [Saguinus oedipus]|uniref:Collagen alpha-1(I) chain-like n=1 Tax=Saguinus oedipus TaxID=9490 RepID=A0ABQ9UKU9_SAGOE|nr:hypothetical protein P7K49_022942 [Saguinus oedipus]
MSSCRRNSAPVLSSLGFPTASKSHKMQDKRKTRETIGVQPGRGGVEVPALAGVGLAPGRGQQPIRPPGPGQVSAAQAGPGESAVRASGQQRAPESQERPAEEPAPAPMPSFARRGPTEPALRRPSSAERPLAPGPSSSRSAGRVPGAMASPSGSSEATGKPRGRDGRPRREEDDVPPEEKRLRLGLEGPGAGPEDGEDAPRPGREETGTQTGGDGRGRQLRARSDSAGDLREASCPSRCLAPTSLFSHDVPGPETRWTLRRPHRGGGAPRAGGPQQGKGRGLRWAALACAPHPGHLVWAPAWDSVEGLGWGSPRRQAWPSPALLGCGLAALTQLLTCPASSCSSLSGWAARAERRQMASIPEIALLFPSLQRGTERQSSSHPPGSVPVSSACAGHVGP